MGESGSGSYMLKELREDYFESVTASGDDDHRDAPSKQCIVFRVSDARFALETASCRQVIKVPEIVPLPDVPQHVLGIINLRGRVVSVVSLASLVGLDAPCPSSRSRLIVIGYQERVTALLVDSVESIIDFSEREMHDVGTVETGARFAVFEVLLGKELLLLLSSEKILLDETMIIDSRG